MNWAEYNKKLVKRGNIHFWISEDAAQWWHVKTSGGRGRPHVYTDKAIETCLTISYLFKMPLRMVEGFLNSFFAREALSIKAPCYTQMSRRTSSIKLPAMRAPLGGKINIAFDSTGLKVFGEGEWKVRMHGASKRRIWRKLHIAVDTETLLIVGASLTKNSIPDAQVAAQMLTDKFEGKVKSVLGDGAYDKTIVYKSARKIGANVIAPPAHNARQQRIFIDPAKLPRDNAIARIRMLGNDEAARKAWKKEAGYHQRSLAETTMYRFKSTFSDRLQHRKMENQSAEAAIKINILNIFARIGFGGTR